MRDDTVAFERCKLSSNAGDEPRTRVAERWAIRPMAPHEENLIVLLVTNLFERARRSRGRFAEPRLSDDGEGRAAEEGYLPAFAGSAAAFGGVGEP